VCALKDSLELLDTVGHVLRIGQAREETGVADRGNAGIITATTDCVRVDTVGGHPVDSLQTKPGRGSEERVKGQIAAAGKNQAHERKAHVA
jgi:hypothetical protein